MTFKYDKLKNLGIEDNYLEFKCPYCKCDGFKKGNWTLKPIGVPWRPDLIDNSDIKNDIIRKGYDRLPDLRSALIMAARKLSPLTEEQQDQIEADNKEVKKDIGNTNPNARISITCNKCKTYVIQTTKVNVSDVRKWCNNNLTFYMDLGIKRD